jgi:hypothetical protein
LKLVKKLKLLVVENYKMMNIKKISLKLLKWAIESKFCPMAIEEKLNILD